MVLIQSIATLIRKLLPTALLFWAAQAVSQMADTLPVVAVSDSLNAPLAAGYSYRVDLNGTSSATRLDELVRKNSTIHVRTTGPGLLAMPSYRGGDAGHSAVLMNGVRLNSPMLGSIDLSTLPLGMFSQAQFFTGTSSATVGAGAMGGGINLVSRPTNDDVVVRGTLTAGSFGEYGLSFGGSVGVVEGFIDFRLNQNKFPYKNIYTTPYVEERMNHADVGALNAGLSFTFTPSKKLDITATMWYSMYDRHIPQPISSALPHTEIQQDSILRSQVVTYWQATEKLLFKFVTHVEDNKNRYANPRISLDNTNRYFNAQQIIVASYQPISTVKVEFQAVPSYTIARSRNYATVHRDLRNSAVLKTEVNVLEKRLLLEGGARAETSDKNAAALPFAGVSVKVWKATPFFVTGAVSRSARFPTINELYWQPGGNPDLRPERGNTVEGGLAWRGKHVDAKAVYFENRFTDRIRWLPEGAIYVPHNIDLSRARGMELHWNSNHKLKRWEFTPYANIAHTLSEGQNAVNGAWMQLSYSPAQQGSAGLEIVRGKWGGACWTEHVSMRYITSDESAHMPAYTLVNADLRCEPLRWLQLSASVLNLLNRDYQNMPWRPMPGRSFRFSATFSGFRGKGGNH